MLPEYEPPPVQAGVLVSSTQPLDLGNAFSTGDVPEFSTKFYTTVVVMSGKDHTVLPDNASLGSVQPMSSDHDQVFSEAADTWLEYAKHTGTVRDSKSVSRSQAQPSSTSSFLRSWSLPAQTTDMAQTGLDLSFSSPFYLNQTWIPHMCSSLQRILALILILKRIFSEIGCCLGS